MRRLLLPVMPVLVLLITGCGSGSSPGTPGGSGTGGVQVVAAENFWGSIASQLGGSKAQVQSIIVNPSSDPHSYEPTAADARTLATAQLVIVNGVGYDPWVSKLLAANPAPGRAVVNVGDLLGLKEGENPHRWYDPGDVDAVAGAITGALERLVPRDAAYFAARLTAFESHGLRRYHELIATIKSRYAGAPVGASESIFALLSPALGLRVVTPSSFMRAISEGTDVSANDTVTTQRQITNHEIDAWIYNAQNATPQIQQLNRLARRNRIPIATVTETLAPAGVSFEAWQVAELEGIARALHQATGR